MRSLLDLRDALAHLIDPAAAGPSPRPPLLAIHRPEIPALCRPFITNRNTILFEIADVRRTHQKPEKFVDDRTRRKLLRCEHGKSIAEIKPQLCAKHRVRARARSVVFCRAAIEDMLQ